MGDLEIVVTGLAVAATVGGATVVARKDSQNSGSGTHSDSESLVRTRLRGWALRLSSCMKAIKNKQPWLYTTILAAHGVVSGALFGADVSTDVRAMLEIRAQGRDAWVWMAAFIALPVLITWIGILQYVRDNLGLSRRALIALAPAVLLAPAAVPLLDVLWLVLKVPPIGNALQRRLPTRFANFMITYGAARTLIETFLESLPQLMIQIYLARASPDDLRLLVPSIVLSFLDFVWVFLNNLYTARKNGRTLARHFDLLRRVGGGAFENALSAIVGNNADAVDLSNLDLNADQARQVADALKGNSALTSLDVRGIGDDAKSAMGVALLSVSTSELQHLTCSEWAITAGATSLQLSQKQLTAADAQLLTGVLKFNRALTSVNLLKNDLGGGAAAVVAAAKQHGKIKTLCGIAEGKTELSFYNQGLRAPDAVLLSFDLEFNRALTSLILVNTQIGAGGAKAIADVLPQS
eukprot:g2660.t1